MMGGHHAISGTAAWMALAGSATVCGHQAGLGLWDLSSEQVLAGAVVATGAALLPDIDHPGATVSRSGACSPGRSPARSAGRPGTAERPTRCWRSSRSPPWPRS